MPDPDGLAAFPDGVWHCHGCRRYLRHVDEVDRHRAGCGPRWRRRKPESARDTELQQRLVGRS